MNRERIKSAFLMLTGKPEITPYLLYIDCAAEKVSRRIKPEFADDPPDCVHTYAAALAAEMLSGADCARESTVCTEAGAAVSERDTSDRRQSAAAQADFWKGICAPYIFDDEFVMLGIRKERVPHAESDTSGDEVEA